MTKKKRPVKTKSRGVKSRVKKVGVGRAIKTSRALKLKKIKTVVPKKRVGTSGSGPGRVGYQANSNFELYDELRNLIIKASPETFPQIKKGLRRVGRVKLALVTGTFLNIDSTRIDLLVVGDRVDIEKLTGLIKDLESEIGKEIRYVLLNSEEFLYRYEMYDRFLRDILDYPHQKVINKLKVS